MEEEKIEDILKAYVSTANNPEYEGNFEEINKKFPELMDAGIDPDLLKEYVALLIILVTMVILKLLTQNFQSLARKLNSIKNLKSVI
mgnify:CR=1 FL=1